jgi:ppGpp synthetase/RelA/SpoT-type nucleotidyltranferase
VWRRPDTHEFTDSLVIFCYCHKKCFRVIACHGQTAARLRTEVSEKILTMFDEKKELYETFTFKAAALIQEILSANGINVHSVTKRIKGRQSLAKKLAKPGAKYNALEDVTDIAAVRVTTYFEDDVDRVVNILINEFQADIVNSVDKRTLLDPDRFGYMSTHHVVQLGAGRCALLEYRRFENLKLEVQTRSILQHAWAEIEHDLGYKSILEVPKDIRRRFSRLSGLLELADSEFMAIRDQLQRYNATVLEEISVRAETADINKDTLAAFIGNDSLIQELDEFIANLADWTVGEGDTNITSILSILNFFKITTVAELGRILKSHSKNIEVFTKVWIGKNPPSPGLTIGQGLSIFYLGFFLAASSSDSDKLDSYLQLMSFRADLAEPIRSAFATAVFTKNESAN